MSAGGSNATAAGPPVPRDQFASRFEDAICDNLGKCCASAGYAYKAAACKVALDGQLAGIFDLNGNYHADRAAQCLQSVSNAMKSCQGMDAAETRPCVGVFTGTAMPGQPCSTNASCGPVDGGYAVCAYPPGTPGGLPPPPGPKYCTLFTRQKLGMPCTYTCTEGPVSTDCSFGNGGSGNNSCYRSDGLYCAKSGVCARLAAVGQPCSEAGCVAGAYCESGTCAAAATAGNACSTYFGCTDGSQCIAGSCMKLKADGELCESWQECASGLCNARCGVKTATAGLCGG